MAQYQQVSYGSRGSAVKELQTALNRRGYGLEVDGVFGVKTRAAVRDFQQKNQLKLDGIAGDETWGRLMRADTAPGEATKSAAVLSGVSDETTAAMRQWEQGYRPSDEVTLSSAAVTALEAARPGDYASPYEEELRRLYDTLQSRPAFAYEAESDPAYRHYAALYRQAGAEAMEDTMGQAAALTGGYGSSYAQSAGYRSYAAYLQKLQELLPTLEENAYRRDQAEREALEGQLDRLTAADRTGYDRWRDAMTDYERELSAARASYEALYKQDRSAYEGLGDYYADKANAEQKAAAGQINYTGAPTAEKTQESLSSTACESLLRTMGSYLRSGNTAEARRLYETYRARLTPEQLRRVTELLEGK